MSHSQPGECTLHPQRPTQGPGRDFKPANVWGIRQARRNVLNVKKGGGHVVILDKSVWCEGS